MPDGRTTLYPRGLRVGEDVVGGSNERNLCFYMLPSGVCTETYAIRTCIGWMEGNVASKWVPPNNRDCAPTGGYASSFMAGRPRRQRDGHSGAGGGKSTRAAACERGSVVR